jgi:hypothetical protein
MVAIRFNLITVTVHANSVMPAACGLCSFHHHRNLALTSGTGIFTMMEQRTLSAPIFPAKGIGVIYWVAYQRGSFSLKERYLCPERARSRCSDLITKARYIRIVPAREGDPPFLTHCFELPAAMSATGPV